MNIATIGVPYGAPVHGEGMKCFLSKPANETFYFNQRYVTQFNSSSSSATRKAIPGSAYIKKILKFFDSHYIVGELFMEYIKYGCGKDENQEDDKDKECNFCFAWTGSPTKRVPQPIPDPDKPFHYVHVTVTPSCTNSGSARPVDDWQPTAHIKRQFYDGAITLQNHDEITKLSEKLYVKREYVVASIEHLTNLQLTKSIRAKTREEQRQRKEKEYIECDWLNLVLEGKLSTLKVFELNKYIDENKLSKKGHKKDKLGAITADVLRKSSNGTIEDLLKQGQVNQRGSEVESEVESDQDIILEEFGSESESDVESINCEQETTNDPIPLIAQTRFGRYAGNWALSVQK